MKICDFGYFCHFYSVFSTFFPIFQDCRQKDSPSRFGAVNSDGGAQLGARGDARAFRAGNPPAQNAIDFWPNLKMAFLEAEIGKNMGMNPSAFVLGVSAAAIGFPFHQNSGTTVENRRRSSL